MLIGIITAVTALVTAVTGLVAASKCNKRTKALEQSMSKHLGDKSIHLS